MARKATGLVDADTFEEVQQPPQNYIRAKWVFA